MKIKHTAAIVITLLTLGTAKGSSLTVMSSSAVEVNLVTTTQITSTGDLSGTQGAITAKAVLAAFKGKVSPEALIWAEKILSGELPAGTRVKGVNLTENAELWQIEIWHGSDTPKTVRLLRPQAK